MGTLTNILYKPKDQSPEGDAYLRLPLETAQLVAGYGIEGDAKGGNPERAVNLLSASRLPQLAALGFSTEPGAFGEQLIVDDLNLESLPEGSAVRIGENSILRITKPRRGCDKFERYQNLPKEAAAGMLGVLASVENGGVIRVGDSVSVV